MVRAGEARFTDFPPAFWMGGRAVEGTGLENRQGGNVFVGSNPTPSASPVFYIVWHRQKKTPFLVWFTGYEVLVQEIGRDVEV